MCEMGAENRNIDDFGGFCQKVKCDQVLGPEKVVAAFGETRQPKDWAARPRKTQTDSKSYTLGFDGLREPISADLSRASSA